MCMPGLAEKVHGLVTKAVAEGARCLVGGTLPDQSLGQFYPPTLLVDVTDDMEIMHEEIFGPVMCVSRCESDEEAVAIANNCPFGLGSSVFSKNQARANEYVPRWDRCQFRRDKVEVRRLGLLEGAGTYALTLLPKS